MSTRLWSSTSGSPPRSLQTTSTASCDASCRRQSSARSLLYPRARPSPRQPSSLSVSFSFSHRRRCGADSGCPTSSEASIGGHSSAMNRRRTPKLPLSHGWVYLLWGKTFPALTSKLALVGQARGGAPGGHRRSGTPLAICFAERRSPTSCPRLHPSQLANFSSDFITPDAADALQTP